MRLWDYRLIPVLDNKHLVALWRECIAIKRQWEKGTLKHRLVSYVTDYDISFFITYVNKIVAELEKRKIKYNKSLRNEIWNFFPNGKYPILGMNYPEHNDRYLLQCLYNLQEKYDRKIISENEWKPIEEFWDKLIKKKMVEENDE